MEMATTAGLAHGEVVLLDAWFNSQKWKTLPGSRSTFM
jgi:hypothetical protein